MAYKFQLGNAKLGGTLQQDGGLVSTDVDDSTAANIVAEIDDGEIAHTKVALEDGDLLIGDASGFAQNRTMGGDATMLANGTVTIANDAVNNDKLANIARGSVKVGGVSNAPTDLSASAGGRILVGDGQDIKSVAVSGDASLAPAGTLTIEAGAVSVAKMADLAAKTVLGNVGNSPAAPAALSPAQIMGLFDADMAGPFTIGNQADDQATFTGTMKIGAGILEFGEGQNAEQRVMDTAHNVAGKDLSISAGRPTAGTTNDVAGGKVQINGGAGKGTGAGGAIEFNVAKAAAGSGNALNSYANAMVISQDKSVRMYDDVQIDGDLMVLGSTVTLSASNLLIEDKIIQVAKSAVDKASSVASGLLFGHEGANSGAQLLYREDAGNRVLRARNGNNTADLDFQANNFRGALVGNATTATTLQSARLIGGVSFNGSADIVPQTITIADEENQNADRLIMFADGAGAFQPKNDGDLTYNPSTGKVSATKFAGDGSELTGLPAGNPAVAAKNPNDELSLGVNLPALASDAHHLFRLPNSAASGDRIWIKAPSNASSARTVNVTGALAGPGLTIDGAASIRLESPDAAVCLVYCGSNAWKVF